MLTLDVATNFRDSVYLLVKSIPPGRVMTYGQIASILGYSRAARAVGGALHVVPDPETTPWWRVINQQGRISTRCDEHPAQFQEHLLVEEGVEFDDKGVTSLDKYRWWPPSEIEERARLRSETIDLFEKVGLK